MYNHAAVIGRMKADPELKKTNTAGKSVCSFCLAVRRDVSRKAEPDAVDWINCVAWGTDAENITKFFHKGDPILVEGRITTRNWEDMKKQIRTATEITVSRWHSLPVTKPKDAKPFEELPADDGDLPF